MGSMSVGNIGTLLGGLGSVAGAGASIYSGLQGKEAADRAFGLQQQALNNSTGLGQQSTLLGLAQLDLQRQLAERQIELANQVLTQTEPFRANVLEGIGGQGGAPRTFNGVPEATVRQLIESNGGAFNSGVGAVLQDAQKAYLAGKADAGPNNAVAVPDRQYAPTPFTMTPAERDAIENQFGVARQNIISNAPVRGGALGTALSNLEMNRAGQVVGLESALARQNQQLQNAAGLTNFQAAINRDQFNATDQINLRNLQMQLDQQRNLANRSLEAQIGYGAPGIALPGLANASQAFNPSSAASIFGPALSAQGNAAGVFGQNFQSGNQQAGLAGQGLGSLAAAGKLAGSKNSNRPSSNQSMSQFFGKS